MNKPNSLTELIKSDLYRICGCLSFLKFINHLLFDNQFKVLFWFRVTSNISKGNLKFLTYLFKYKYRRVSRRIGIDLPYQTSVGKGLLLHHGYGLVVNRNVIIGNNVTLSHGVTIGDEKGFSPVIRDMVIISPGAKIFGNITLGKNSIIGANAVVLSDVPENNIAVGIPSHTKERRDSHATNRNYWETS